jgi:histidinol dehydrogenase
MSLRILEWQQLGQTARAQALARPAQEARADIASQAAGIIDDVRERGDAALFTLTQRFDRVSLDALQVPDEELERAPQLLSGEHLAAMQQAIANVRAFHAAQTPRSIRLETVPGVTCERVSRPIGSVGLYVPAGSAPLPSAVIMLAVPAGIAGCPRAVLCTPPAPDGRANSAVLAAAALCGVRTVFKVGGAQAIAALAYGTASIPKVDKIFGPGNAWVTAAKQQVASDPAGAAVDMPAGPSEVLVIADESAQVPFVAADLLAQAEHDTQAQAILVTPSAQLARAVAAEVEAQSLRLSRRAILAKSLKDSRAIVVPDLAVAFEVANRYAPEHLILALETPRVWLDQVTSAGSIFLGHWTPEPMGDYCSGTNHVLPTYGYARAYSGLSVLDFMKQLTVQELTPAGLVRLGPVAVSLAQLEGLDAHARAVTARLDVLAGQGGA